MSKQKNRSQQLSRTETENAPEQSSSPFSRYIQTLRRLLHAAALIRRLPFQVGSTDITEESVKRRIEELVTAHVQRRSDLIILTSYPSPVQTVAHNAVQRILSIIYTDLNARSLLPLTRLTTSNLETDRLLTEPLTVEQSFLKDLAVATEDVYLVIGKPCKYRSFQSKSVLHS